MPFRRMRFADADQFLRKAHARLARNQRVTAHAREQVERDLREAHARVVLREHEMVCQRRFEATAERRPFHHRNRDRARVEATRRGMHTIDARTGVGHQRFTLARTDRIGKEIEVAADVEHRRDQRTRHPEIDRQSGFACGARKPQDVVHEFNVEARPRLRTQHHPHDVAAFFVIGGNLGKIAGFEEGTAGVVVTEIHFGPLQVLNTGKSMRA